MKRNAYNDLLEWKNAEIRKPLLLQGARQVGKTFLVREFGKKEYDDLVYLNFEQIPDLKDLFSTSLIPSELIHNISLFIGRKISAKHTLIVFDEIQNAPNALTSLKYFHEEAPEFHIIGAGSLLGVSVGKSNSFPVGKVSFMTLYPMSFYEYLIAVGEELLATSIRNKHDFSSIPTVLHEKLLKLVKLYFFLGGMPEVIQTYIQTNDTQTARKVQLDILDAYARDFSKYAAKSQAIKTSEVWNSLPYQLAKENKKFKFSDVKKKARLSTYEQTIEWLKKAGLIHVVYNIKTAKLPLSGYADHSKFKIYLMDTGLLGAMLKLTSKTIVLGDALFSGYNGAFTENFVANELIVNGDFDLYYWTSGNMAEVDFIVQRDNFIIPIEVKSGYGKNLKSLRSFQTKYHSKRIMRISPRNFMQADDFSNLPLYAISSFSESALKS